MRRALALNPPCAALLFAGTTGIKDILAERDDAARRLKGSGCVTPFGRQVFDRLNGYLE